MGGGQKGFTLIELIVVIVILAILVGVTIGGIFHYINEARKSVDINNCNAINTALQDLRGSKEINDIVGNRIASVTYYREWTSDNCSFDGFYMHRVDDTGNSNVFSSGSYSELSVLVDNKIRETFPDGYPEIKEFNAIYRITITIDSSSDSYNPVHDIFCGIFSKSAAPKDFFGVPLVSLPYGANIDDFCRKFKSENRIY